MTKPRNNNKTKENNKSGKDTSGKRPASSSPAGNVSGQGPSLSSPSENTSPSTTSSNKKARPPSGPVDTTSVEHTSQTNTSSLDASFHAPNNDGDKGKSVEKTPVVSFPEHAASPDASTAAVQSQPTKFYASAAPNAIEGFWNHFATNRNALDDTWAVLCKGHCLRICPASFSPDQRKERRTYVALLAGLPRGTIAADLAEIAHEVSTKSINVPFFMNSYNPKPYAYCHFTSQTAMDAAMEISCALKNIGSPYIPTINWTEISDALQAVVQEVAALTAQMANMNSRLKVVEHTLANPPSKISSGASAPYILTLMHGWDDPPASSNHNNNSSGKLIDVNSPPTVSTPGFTSISQFSPLPSSVVAPNSPNDMEQRLSHLTNTVSRIIGTVQKGIEQQTQLLALRQGQSKN
ncbi:hypothetical protein C1646_767619 [Rhizophagus diaphanus]|nr:hypothetical protein C1646_767619 [Rhizophagus diaphanus] [Rhizophagus sp. MUCL 43196]